jgi:hypothetical protein
VLRIFNGDVDKMYALLMDPDLSVDHAAVLKYLSDLGIKAAEDLELLEGDKFDPLFDQLRIVPKKKLKMWLNSK